jgi:hypothetical protein
MVSSFHFLCVLYYFLFFIERNPPIQKVLDAGLLPRFIEFMKLDADAVCFFLLLLLLHFQL